MHANTYMQRHMHQALAKTPSRACVISAACWSVAACVSLPHVPGKLLSEATQSVTERGQKRRIQRQCQGCSDGRVGSVDRGAGWHTVLSAEGPGEVCAR